jgi:hypothetical protein
LRLIAGAAEAIARLDSTWGVMSDDELDRVHNALTDMLAAKGGRVASMLRRRSATAVGLRCCLADSAARTT